MVTAGKLKNSQDEDWCPACRKHVDEWVVSYETTIHTDSGYDRIRRCPHCNEMCIDDSSFTWGCLFFFVGLFGSGFLFQFIYNLAGKEFDIKGDGQAAVFMALAFGVTSKKMCNRRKCIS